MGTLAWIGSSVLSNSIAVCECGIIGDIHRRNHAISWSQVTDYFEYNRCGVQGVVLLYRARDGAQRRRDFPVPRDRGWAFMAQLSARFDASGTVRAAPARRKPA